MQKLVNGEWVDCTEEELVVGDIYRIPVGDGGWQQSIYSEPEEFITLTIEGDKAYNVMQLGQTLSFTATFSDLTINASIPVSIVDRSGIQVSNAFVVIKDGIGTGTFTPDVAIDYFVTEEAINFHSDALGKKLVLAEPFYIRVVQS